MRTSVQIIQWSLALVVLTAFHADSKPSVYIMANPEDSGERPKANARELLDSAGDVRAEIEKRRDIVPASDISSADIVVTILDRRVEVDQIRQDYGGGHIQNHYQSRHLILYRISVGGSNHDSEYFMAGSLVTWKRVASGLSKQIERWAKDNMEAIWRARETKQVKPRSSGRATFS